MKRLADMKRRRTRSNDRPSPEIVTSPSLVVEVADLRLDGGTQPREAMDLGLLQDYASRMVWSPDQQHVVDLDGRPWPAIVVFKEGTTLWLADGFHRTRAATHGGLTTFQAIVKEGTQDDAILFSLGANSDHGKRRTKADIKRSIETVLRHPEWSGRSDTWLARICKVTDKTIARHRQRLEDAAEIPFTLELETASTSYIRRRPPRPLDDQGYLVVQTTERPKAPRRKEPTTPSTRGDFASLGTLNASVLVAFPETLEDCDLLLTAIETSPELVLIPIALDSTMAYQAPQQLAPLVDEHNLVGPRPVYIIEQQRHFFAWSRSGDTPSIVNLASEFLETDQPVFCGQPLGGWDAYQFTKN